MASHGLFSICRFGTLFRNTISEVDEFFWGFTAVSCSSVAVSFRIDMLKLDREWRRVRYSVGLGMLDR